MREDGVLHGGPPCGSFTWLNRGTSKRTLEEPWGDLCQPSVIVANAFLDCRFSHMWVNMWNQYTKRNVDHLGWEVSGAGQSAVSTSNQSQSSPKLEVSLKPRIISRYALVLALAVARCVYILVEQPRNSIMPYLPWFQEMAVVLRSFGIKWDDCNLLLPYLTLFRRNMCKW